MASSQKRYNNEFVFQKTLKILMNETADVQFIFEMNVNDDEDEDAANVSEHKKSRAEIEGGVVKICAHKKVLAISSPVFDAMFNGELKENGDIKILDSSPDAFTEFLQFFYENQVKLSMESIVDVLELIDKYDVASGLGICVDFFKDNLTTDDILWGLSLAFKFRLDDLMKFCSNVIQKNCAKVCKMFVIDANGKAKLCSNPNNRPLSDEDLTNIFPHIFKITQNVITNPAMVTDCDTENGIYPFTLTTGVLSKSCKVRESQCLSFSLTGTLLLTDILWSHLFKYSEITATFDPIESNFEMWIEGAPDVSTEGSKILFTGKFRISRDGENRVTLPNPIKIQSNHIYTIYTKIIPYSPLSHTYRSSVPMETIPLAPQVSIEFTRRYDCYLVSALYFTRQNVSTSLEI